MSKEKENEILITLGSNLKRLRKARKMSQQELADRSNIHRNYVISLEKGRQNPSLLVLFGLAKALKVTVKALYVEKQKDN